MCIQFPGFDTSVDGSVAERSTVAGLFLACGANQSAAMCLPGFDPPTYLLL